jgi:hypothetical protein
MIQASSAQGKFTPGNIVVALPLLAKLDWPYLGMGEDALFG